MEYNKYYCLFLSAKSRQFLIIYTSYVHFRMCVQGKPGSFGISVVSSISVYRVYRLYRLYRVYRVCLVHWIYRVIIIISGLTATFPGSPGLAGSHLFYIPVVYFIPGIKYTKNCFLYLKDKLQKFLIYMST